MEHENQKLLVVTGKRLSPQLVEYAVNVAVRLDLEILVLFIDEGHGNFDADHRKSRVAEFEKETEKAATEFTALAWKSSVKVTTIVDVDERQRAISRTKEEDANIRFMVSDGSGDRTDTEKGRQYPRLEVVQN